MASAMTSLGVMVPEVSQAELASFQQAHFSRPAVEHFDTHFMHPSHDRSEGVQVAEEQYEEEDDGLGYYGDGTKRTLTDEQIAMFRHSEVEALRRAGELSGSRDTPNHRPSAAASARGATGLEPGELPSGGEPDTHHDGSAPKKKKRRRRAKTHEQAEKPDLRKRTWDVVEAGLERLDYDDGGQEPPTAARGPQRRHISYDD